MNRRMSIVLKHYRRQHRSDSTLAGASTGTDYEPVGKGSADELNTELRALDSRRSRTSLLATYFPTFTTIVLAILGGSR